MVSVLIFSSIRFSLYWLFIQQSQHVTDHQRKKMKQESKELISMTLSIEWKHTNKIVKKSKASQPEVCQQRAALWGDLPLDCIGKLASARWCQGSKSTGDFSGNLRIIRSWRLGYSHRNTQRNNSKGNLKNMIHWFHSLGSEALQSTDSAGKKNKCMQISFLMKTGDQSQRACWVWCL